MKLIPGGSAQECSSRCRQPGDCFKMQMHTAASSQVFSLDHKSRSAWSASNRYSRSGDLNASKSSIRFPLSWYVREAHLLICQADQLDCLIVPCCSQGRSAGTECELPHRHGKPGGYTDEVSRWQFVRLHAGAESVRSFMYNLRRAGDALMGMSSICCICKQASVCTAFCSLNPWDSVNALEGLAWIIC